MASRAFYVPAAASSGSVAVSRTAGLPSTAPSSAAAAASLFASASMTAPYGVDMHIDAEVGAPTSEMLHKMRRIENDGRVYAVEARYLPFRRVLVDWICECGENFRLANSTSHVAVGYMDKVLQMMEVHKDRLQVVAIACLLIAGKYEEREEACPTAERLVQYVREEYQREGGGGPPPVDGHTVSLVHQMEVLILNRLNWCLTIVTPLHYLGMFHRKGVVFENDTIGYKPLQQRVVKYLKKYTDFFADLCLQEYAFNTYPPSLLAAAMVVASRRSLNLAPVWNPALLAVLGYTEEDIAAPFQAVWRHYAASFPSKVKEADDMAAATLREALEKGLVRGPEAAAAPSSSSSSSSSLPGAAAVAGALSPLAAAHLAMAASPASAMNATVIATPASAQASTPDENFGYLSGGPASAGGAGAGASASASAACLDSSGYRQLTFSGVHVGEAAGNTGGASSSSASSTTTATAATATSCGIPLLDGGKAGNNAPGQQLLSPQLMR